MVAIIVSDSAQYYTGRALGRRPLAPSISPKKTLEGAIGGLVFGTACVRDRRTVGVSRGPSLLARAARRRLHRRARDRRRPVRVAAEAQRRRQGLGPLIPGHGGVLDRIDSWLFAAPVYYVFVRYLQF